MNKELNKIFDDFYSKTITVSIFENKIRKLLQEDKWISVEDELPKENGLYLVCSINNESGYKNTDTGRYYKGKWNLEEYYEGMEHNYKPYKITHWQPLPKPPKEK